MRNALCLLVLALVAGPAFAPAQKKDDILEIQRDIAGLDERVRNLQSSHDKDMEALRQIMQQAVTASTQVNQGLATLERTLASTLSTGLNDQQNKISLAVSPLATQMDALSKSVDALTATVGQMNGRISSLDSKLTDISDKVSTINQPPPAPPASAAVSPDAPENGVPAGVTRAGLRESAEQDYASGYDDMALKEFANYIKYFPLDEYAPSAGYFMGMVYARGKDYDDAVQAFQKVIDTWPANNKAQDALYQKAVALEKGGHKTEAIAAFREFVKKYPVNDYIQNAKADLARLTAGSRSKRPAK